MKVKRLGLLSACWCLCVFWSEMAAAAADGWERDRVSEGKRQRKKKQQLANNSHECLFASHKRKSVCVSMCTTRGGSGALPSHLFLSQKCHERVYVCASNQAKPKPDNNQTKSKTTTTNKKYSTCSKTKVSFS